MKILLFGKNGQVGWELQRSLAPLASTGQLIALGTGSREICGNLDDPAGIRETVQTINASITRTGKEFSLEIPTLLTWMLITMSSTLTRYLKP